MDNLFTDNNKSIEKNKRKKDNETDKYLTCLSNVIICEEISYKKKVISTQTYSGTERFVICLIV